MVRAGGHMMGRSERPILMRRFAAVLAVFAVSLAVAAQTPMTPQQALTRLMTAPVQAAWFDKEFLAKVPVAQVEQIVEQYTGQWGKFQSVQGSGSSYTVFLERASFPAKVALNAQGQFIGLWFGVAQPRYASFDESVKPFRDLPGKVSLLVLENGAAKAAVNADDPMAVGSAFKLAVLAALKKEIAAGKHRWDEVVPLRPAWKTLPSGVIRTWPDETPMTLATYANEMISISDNTAADALLAIAGRREVEAVSPRNTPFLSTREAFILKDPDNAGLLEKWRSADAAGRAALLPEIDRKPLPDPGIFVRDPLATDVEWFLTATELCRLIDSVRELGAMHINPGLADAKDWQQVAFKGGSEPGVLNLTTELTDRQGHHSCVAATWNNSQALDENRFYTLYGGVLSALAAESSH